MVESSASKAQNRERTGHRPGWIRFAKLLAGPATASGIHRTNPATTSGMHQPHFAAHVTSAV